MVKKGVFDTISNLRTNSVCSSSKIPSVTALRNAQRRMIESMWASEYGVGQSFAEAIF